MAGKTSTQRSRTTAHAWDKACGHPNYANHTLYDCLPRRECYWPGLAQTIHCPQSYFNVLSLLGKKTVIQQYITILSHHCSNSHHRQHLVSNKEASHSVPAKKPIHTVGMPRGTSVCSEGHKTGFLCACVCVCLGERDGGGELTDNSLCDCLVRKCFFIPFLLPLIYFLI